MGSKLRCPNKTTRNSQKAPGIMPVWWRKESKHYKILLNDSVHYKNNIITIIVTIRNLFFTIVNKFLLLHDINVRQWKNHWPTRNWTGDLPLTSRMLYQLVQFLVGQWFFHCLTYMLWSNKNLFTILLFSHMMNFLFVNVCIMNDYGLIFYWFFSLCLLNQSGWIYIKQCRPYELLIVYLKTQ